MVDLWPLAQREQVCFFATADFGLMFDELQDFPIQLPQVYITRIGDGGAVPPWISGQDAQDRSIQIA